MVTHRELWYWAGCHPEGIQFYDYWKEKAKWHSNVGIYIPVVGQDHTADYIDLNYARDLDLGKHTWRSLKTAFDAGLQLPKPNREFLN